MSDLANSTYYGQYHYKTLFVKEGEMCTDTSVSLDASIAQYTLCALTNTGVTAFVVGTHTADQAVLNLQPVTAVGQACPIATEAENLNHERITWPASLNTYAKRLAFVQGTKLGIGQLINDGIPSWAS